MKEIEVKILEVSHKELESKLFELGAKKLFDKEFHAKIFDTPNKDLNKQNAILRLRKEGDKVVLTHKIGIPTTEGTKINEETEIEVSDFDETIKLLSILGYVENPIKEGRKNRVSYQLGSVRVEFDKHLPPHEFIPEFMEIEGPSSEEVYACVAKLGFSKEDCKDWTGKDLIDYYSK